MKPPNLPVDQRRGEEGVDVGYGCVSKELRDAQQKTVA